MDATPPLQVEKVKPFRVSHHDSTQQWLEPGVEITSKVSIEVPRKDYYFTIKEPCLIVLTIAENNTASRCSLCLSPAPQDGAQESDAPTPANAIWKASDSEPRKSLSVLPVDPHFCTGNFIASVVYVKESGVSHFSVHLDTITSFNADWSYPSGRRYSGMWREIHPHGKGTMYFTNGDVYTGQYVQGLKDGHGTYQWKTGNKYTGTWAAGRRSGRGRMEYSSVVQDTQQQQQDDVDAKPTAAALADPSDTPPASAAANRSATSPSQSEPADFAASAAAPSDASLRHSVGKRVSGLPDKVSRVVYDGEWLRDHLDGVGTMFYSDGSRYDGEWSHDMRQGIGTLWFAQEDQALPFAGRLVDTATGELPKALLHGETALGAGGLLCSFGEWIADALSVTGRSVCTLLDGTRYTGNWDICAGGPVLEGVLDDISGVTLQCNWVGGVRHGVGVITFPGGVTVKAKFVNGALPDTFHVIYASGEVYNGQFNLTTRRKEGTGRSNTAGGVYEGHWADDQLHGTGSFENAVTGYRYDGEWATGHRHGKGRAHLADESTYDGEWVLDHMEGSGMCTYADKSSYNGEWKASQRAGKGRWIGSDGKGCYDGHWICNVRSGDGLEISSDGEQYVGDFCGDRRHGKGTLTLTGDRAGQEFTGTWSDGVPLITFGSLKWSNGQRYTGSFNKDLLPEGRGIMIIDSRSSYEGEWLGGLQHGKGTLRDRNGVLHSATWDMGARAPGEGRAVYSTGEVYEGEWLNERPHGVGALVYPDGTRFEGRFEEGLYVV